MTDDEDDEDDLLPWGHQLNPNQYPAEHVFETLVEVSNSPFNRTIKTKLHSMYQNLKRRDVPKKHQKDLSWIFKEISQTNARKLSKLKVYKGLDTPDCKLVCLLVRKTSKKNNGSTTKNSIKKPAVESATSSNSSNGSNDSSSNESSSNESSNDFVETATRSSNAFTNFYNVKQQQGRAFRKQQSKKRSRAKKNSSSKNVESSSEVSSKDIMFKDLASFVQKKYGKNKKRKRRRVAAKSSSTNYSTSSSTSSRNKKMKFSSSKDNEIKKLRRQLKVLKKKCYELINHIKYLKGLLRVCNQEYKRMGKIFNKR